MEYWGRVLTFIASWEYWRRVFTFIARKEYWGRVLTFMARIYIGNIKVRRIADISLCHFTGSLRTPGKYWPGSLLLFRLGKQRPLSLFFFIVLNTDALCPCI